jgi:hypothetical protein
MGPYQNVSSFVHSLNGSEVSWNNVFSVLSSFLFYICINIKIKIIAGIDSIIIPTVIYWQR